IGIAGAGAAQGIPAGAAEAYARDRTERQRIEIRCSGADLLRLCDRRLHLVCRLAVARRVERSAGSANGERRAAEGAHDAVDLPVADRLLDHPVAGRKMLSFPERQIIHPADLEHVGTIKAGHGTVLLQFWTIVERQASPTIVISPVNRLGV